MSDLNTITLQGVGRTQWRVIKPLSIFPPRNLEWLVQNEITRFSDVKIDLIIAHECEQLIPLINALLGEGYRNGGSITFYSADVLLGYWQLLPALMKVFGIIWVQDDGLTEEMHKAICLQINSVYHLHVMPRTYLFGVQTNRDISFCEIAATHWIRYRWKKMPQLMPVMGPRTMRQVCAELNVGDHELEYYKPLFYVIRNGMYLGFTT